MKKFLIIMGLLVCGMSVFAQTSKEYTYSPAYIQHLKVCAKYTDEYTTTIPTGDVNSPYLRVKSTEEIFGWLNGKCRTKSTVYSLDLDKKILAIKCEVNRKQLSSIVQKMKNVNDVGSAEAKKALQDELTSLIEDKAVCRSRNFLEE